MTCVGRLNTSWTYDNIVHCQRIELFPLIFRQDRRTKGNQANKVRERMHCRTNCAQSIRKRVMSLDPADGAACCPQSESESSFFFSLFFHKERCRKLLAVWVFFVQPLFVQLNKSWAISVYEVFLLRHDFQFDLYDWSIVALRAERGLFMFLRQSITFTRINEGLAPCRIPRLIHCQFICKWLSSTITMILTLFDFLIS